MSLILALGYKMGINPREYQAMTKTRFFAPLAAAALLAAGSAPAFAKSEGSQNSSGSAAASAEAGERKICKRFDNSASRLRSERLCLTKAEWKKFEAAE